MKPRGEKISFWELVRMAHWSKMLEFSWEMILEQDMLVDPMSESLKNLSWSSRDSLKEAFSSSDREVKVWLMKKCSPQKDLFWGTTLSWTFDSAVWLKASRLRRAWMGFLVFRPWTTWM